MDRRRSPSTRRPSATSPSPSFLLLLILVVVSLLPATVTAVDRSKFRTCAQTSFCRRHRGGHSKRLYKYAVKADTIHFRPPPPPDGDGEEAGAGGGGGAEGGGGASDGASDPKPPPGLWGNIKRMMGGSEGAGGTQKGTEFDPHVRGPPAIFGAVLSNVATETSTGARKKEELDLTVHLHDDGTARVRVTERYGTLGALYEKARWTSDELVLNENEMRGSNSVELLTSNDAPRVEEKDKDDLVALKYGKVDEKKVLLIRLDPFEFALYEDGKDVPLVSAGGEGLMHFEIRRAKEEEGPPKEEEEPPKEEKPKEEKPASKVKVDAAASQKKAEGGEGDDRGDRHGGKEIVGYWEDGLAIYADGTREEKEVEDEEESHHRQLLEEQDPDLDKEGMWEESFHSHTDSKPNGPMSVGLDITFPRSEHLFGLPEHASSTQLKTTFGDGRHYHEPYRLYNLDVFEYELDETMALYGHVPLIVSHSLEGGTVGAFWFNPSETYVDVLTHDDDAQNDADQVGTKTHWMSESGIFDLFLLPGNTPRKLYEQYAHLTGRTPIPPMFGLGYHQCRWNYKDERDVDHVHSKFEELDYPYDVLWLDIEHTDGKRYFTWDDNAFPTPEDMQKKLWDHGRRMVTIVDPHIKRDDKYYIHKEATSKGLYVKDNSGTKDYDGWCWPGSSSYLDFTNDRVRSWWSDQFSYDKYKGSTPSLFTWNDMNEPSVFNGPEVSMQKDLLNLDGVEHREWHNLYGLLFQRATAEGLVKRNKPDMNVRPFVLTRAFFASSQRHGAIWTGDNEAKWSHLEIASPMLLSLNVASLSFVGADVGGFFGDPDAELMTRWMQAGSYQPFFRGHAHHDSKRREPWMFGDETLRRLRDAAMARYALLPFWYTVFREAAATGMPVMRTMWMQYPTTRSLFSVDDQYMIGSDLLVKPVTAPGVVQTRVSFPDADVWYDVDTLQKMPTTATPPGGRRDGTSDLTVKSPIDKIPAYQRGGSIVPRKLRLRRSAYLMKTDPYTLYVALDAEGKATGMLYMDDEETFDHERKGEYAMSTFSTDWNSGVVLRNEPSLGVGYDNDKVQDLKDGRMVERIVVMGAEATPKEIRVIWSGSGTTLDFEHDAASRVLVVRKPGVSALVPFEISVLR